MEIKEYISSGILELYVYGLLTESENVDVSKMASENSEVDAEIVSIEKAIVNLSSSFSPFLSVENFAKIKSKLELKHSKVIELKANKKSGFQYLGWAAAAIFFLGAAYLFSNKTLTENQLATLEADKIKLKEVLTNTERSFSDNKNALAIVQDPKNTVIALGGQAVSPTSYAKVYYNQETNVVNVDVSGLPNPPEGMVYQIWSLKLKPTLTPTSIGLIANFDKESTKIFAVENTDGAEAFGITLEPAGGSAGPTMEQLYALGKV